MQSLTTILSLSTLISAAAITQRDATTTTTATLSPYLAPACQVTDTATQLVCNFPALTLTVGQCQDITTQCAVHPPTSFTAQLNGANLDQQQCHIAVFPNFGCYGDEVDGGVLGVSQSGCVEAPYFGKALNGGVLSSSLLPFGFKSAKLVCS
ncbi:hypothetical protein PMZ80_004320 [Knufia obscura]|uniref:Uncharacterized protein n=1 Tax=Knufia obscura TaxID=1635080 RepID=A0ABR0RSS1_9EURO|nr:hypothetical protein PMZ80_004320 [Knufia obscura]